MKAGKAHLDGDGHIPPELRRCLARVIVEYRDSVARNRPIAWPNLRRLLDRYWHQEASSSARSNGEVCFDSLDWAHVYLWQLISPRNRR